MTPAGIEPQTFRFVTQRSVNQMRLRITHISLHALKHLQIEFSIMWNYTFCEGNFPNLSQWLLKFLFEGSECLEFCEFQDHFYALWVWEIFISAIIQLTFKHFQTDFKAVMLSNIALVLTFCWPCISVYLSQ